MPTKTRPRVDRVVRERLRGSCGLFIDVQPGETVAAGDWIATEAGSCYLVLHSQLVHRRRHAQQLRYKLRCARLEKNTPIPHDVVTWWLRWYPRGSR